MTPADTLMDATLDRVTALIARSGKGPVGPADDLRGAGFTSLDVVNLMLEVEEAFDLQIPQASMTPKNFRSAETIAGLVRALRPA